MLVTGRWNYGVVTTVGTVRHLSVLIYYLKRRQHESADTERLTKDILCVSLNMSLLRGKERCLKTQKSFEVYQMH